LKVDLFEHRGIFGIQAIRFEVDPRELDELLPGLG
jgi:hypothetical protein